jgi:FkbM family methyltransferase
VKLRNILEFFGFKGKPKKYSYELVEFNLEHFGVVRYAQWNHPAESRKAITSQLVEGYQGYIAEGDFCIDIGAHSGDTTLPMALAAGKSGCVLALEPNPYVYHVLQKTARANPRLTNIFPLMAAAGKEEGFMEFEYSDSGFCNGGRHENMPFLVHGHAFRQRVFSIDLEKELRSDFESFLPRLSFLKVDAEGYDLYILLSIERIILEYRPIIKAEVFKKTSSEYRQDLLRFFEMANYSAYRIDSEPLGKGEKLTSETISNQTHYDILALPN